jgi:hypothetical protein
MAQQYTSQPTIAPATAIRCVLPQRPVAGFVGCTPPVSLLAGHVRNRSSTRYPRARAAQSIRAARCVVVASVVGDAGNSEEAVDDHGGAGERDNTGDSDGTTSLLARVRFVQCSTVLTFLRGWLRDYLFAAQSALGPPTSVGSVGRAPALFFYAPDGAVRGLLTLDARTSGDAADQIAVIRVSSSSRFMNPSGVVSASLPGERRIVRKLFLDLQDAFGPTNVQVLYKPAFIRLGSRAHEAGGGPSVRAWPRHRLRNALPRPIDKKRNDGDRVKPQLPKAWLPLSPSFGIIFVAQVRCSPLADVLGMVDRWGPSAYVGADAREGRDVEAGCVIVPL